MTEPREKRINVESIFGQANREPLVNVVFPDGADRISMRPDEARALALNLLEAAEGALGDGFVIEFFMTEMELSLQQAALMMVKFRGYRARRSAAGT